MKIDFSYQLGSCLTKGISESSGRIYLSGTQALVRMLLAQAASDRLAGLNTAGFVSGYRGSPLGSLDKEMWRASDLLKKSAVRFQPAVNEELAATALIGTQKVETDPTRTVQGVFSMWYGKGPGVDRAGDALKHGNAYGSSPTGGVLVVVGDDHGCVSSSMSHQSDHALMAWSMPIIHPAGIDDYVSYGLWGWALSRFSGCWVGFKAISDTVEGSAAISSELKKEFVLPEIDSGPDGLHWRWPDLPGMQIERRLAFKLAAVMAFARANPIDTLTINPKHPRVLIAAVGKAHGDVMELVNSLGESMESLYDKGIAIMKIGLVYPLSPMLSEFSENVEEVIVVEEKGAVVETLLKKHLYNLPSERRPIVLGKVDRNGIEFLPTNVEIRPSTIAAKIANRLRCYGLNPVVPSLWREPSVKAISAVQRHSLVAVKPVTHSDLAAPARTPYFCSGCPHNTSTRVPEGSRAQLGIGCHAMAVHMDRQTSGSVQMGGEGVDWVGQSPFVSESHIFQNIGDGTFFHSGQLAIRQAVAANINITYKILYNDAVAMTGGQPVDGHLSAQKIARLVMAEGVRKLVVVADNPKKYSPHSGFDKSVEIKHRDELDKVQRELRNVSGVTAIIYDQVCSAEARRRRKREKPATRRRVIINELVCEGCGDCQVQSNCLSIIPVNTPYGRKRRVEDSSCNSDFSCLKGFCPSFVTVDVCATTSKSKGVLSQEDVTRRASKCPTPVYQLDQSPYEILVAGVGGTGVVTIGALIAVASHLEGLHSSVLDFTGFSQKGGSVLSHVRIAKAKGLLNTMRMDTHCADVLIASDLVVGAKQETLDLLGLNKTRVVASTREIQTGVMLRNPNSSVDTESLLGLISSRVGSDAIRSFDVQSLTEHLVGGIHANVLILGFAWQAGLIPISFAALDRAIELNAVSIDKNKEAFAWGRLFESDPKYVMSLIGGGVSTTAASETVDEIVARNASFLYEYQNGGYSRRYLANIKRIQSICKIIGDFRLESIVAKNLFKLMAYKDEYEVARLYAKTGFVEKLYKEHGKVSGMKFYIYPPILFSIFSSKKTPQKIKVGSWIIYVFRVLASMKSIRGTVFDVFSYTSERKNDRRMIVEYESLIDKVFPLASPDNIGDIIELASLPLFIRGYGPVKDRAIDSVEKRKKELLRCIFGSNKSESGGSHYEFDEEGSAQAVLNSGH